MGKLFDEDCRETQLLLIGRIGEFLAVAVADIEAVMNFPVLNIKLRFGDVHVPHREGVGKSVQEGRCIVRPDFHDRIEGGLAVIERDLHGMEQATKRCTALAELFD